MILPYREHKFAEAKRAVERIIMEMNESATGKIPWPAMAPELIDTAVCNAIEKVAGPRMVTKNLALLQMKQFIQAWSMPDGEQALYTIEAALEDKTYDAYIRFEDVKELLNKMEELLKGLKESGPDANPDDPAAKCLQRVQEFLAFGKII